jgi:hypothetical protein
MISSGEPKVTVPDARTVNAMGERVAILETRIAALKEDTTTIRAGMHGMNNEMQKFVAAEAQCVNKLALILEALKDLPLILASIAAFNEMRPDLRSVIADKEQRAGLSAFGKKFSMVIIAGAAFVGIIGGVIGALIWLTEHLKPV